MKKLLTTTAHSPTPPLKGRRKRVMTDLEQWMAQRAKKDEQLYERYGRPLEKEHTGKYAAIGPDGQVVFGVSTDEVLQKGVETFGSGNFGLFRIGHPALGKWLTLTK